MVGSSGQTFVQFAFMTAVSAQSGIHRPQQVFCLLHVALDEGCGMGGDQFSDMMLELATAPYITPTGTHYLPGQPCKAGALKMMATDEFVEYLLDMPAVADPNNHVVDVRISLLCFEDILPSVVRVIGVDPDIGTLTFDSPMQHVDNDDGPMQNMEDASSRPVDDQRSSVDPLVVDLMSELENLNLGTETPPPKKRTRTKESNQSVVDDNRDPQQLDDGQSITKGKTMSLLDDPCLEAILSPNDISAFREVEQFCATVHTATTISEKRATEPAEGGSDSDSDGDILLDASLPGHEDTDAGVETSKDDRCLLASGFSA